MGGKFSYMKCLEFDFFALLAYASIHRIHRDHKDLSIFLSELNLQEPVFIVQFPSLR